MGSWSGYTRALSEPVRGWVTSGSGISQREDTELIEMNQESGTDVVRKGEEDNGTLHVLNIDLRDAGYIALDVELLNSGYSKLSSSPTRRLIPATTYWFSYIDIGCRPCVSI